MNQMNQITQQNASSSEELAATAEEMTSQAEQLKELVSFSVSDRKVCAPNRTIARAANHAAPSHPRQCAGAFR
jgi:methyl-accepting chemotaxis protein